MGFLIVVTFLLFGAGMYYIGRSRGFDIGVDFCENVCDHDYTKWKLTRNGPVYWQQNRSCRKCGNEDVEKWH